MLTDGKAYGHLTLDLPLGNKRVGIMHPSPSNVVCNEIPIFFLAFGSLGLPRTSKMIAHKA